MTKMAAPSKLVAAVFYCLSLAFVTYWVATTASDHRRWSSDLRASVSEAMSACFSGGWDAASSATLRWAWRMGTSTTEADGIFKAADTTRREQGAMKEDLGQIPTSTPTPSSSSSPPSPSPSPTPSSTPPSPPSSSLSSSLSSSPSLQTPPPPPPPTSTTATIKTTTKTRVLGKDEDHTDIPIDHVRMDLSVILLNETFGGTEVYDVLVGCLANHSGTSRVNWMVNDTDPFSPTMTQVELYADVLLSRAEEFAVTTDEYIREDRLSECMREELAGSGGLSRVFAGRTVVSSTFVGSNSDRGIKSWIVGIGVAAMALLALGIIVATAPSSFETKPRNDEYGQYAEYGGQLDANGEVIATQTQQNIGATGARTERKSELQEHLESVFYNKMARDPSISELAGPGIPEVSISAPAASNRGRNRPVLSV